MQVGLNISEKRQSREVQLLIMNALENSGDAIGMADPLGNHFYQNRAFTGLFEYTPEELSIAGGPRELYADRDVAGEVFEKISHGGSWNGEVAMVSRGGRRFPVLLRADAIKDVSGNIIGLIGIHRDITESKRADEKLKKHERELSNNRKDLQKLAGRLISNQERELSRLARELHDDVTQRLAVLAIDAGNIEKQFQDLPDAVMQKIVHIKNEVIKVSKDIHNLSRQLHPSILDDLGLVRAVEWECSSFSTRTGLAVVFTPENIPEKMPRDAALGLYRILQECLSNIAKHGQTKNAYVFLEGDNKNIMLSVRDTGAGFDFSQVRRKAGLGLASMRERARLIKGKLSISSQPGKGTLIEVRVPVKGKVLNEKKY
jgi:PAS domain S-box-containing protein